MTLYLGINWAVAGTQVLYLILSLSLLVILHEMGHFIPAKLFKCRVEKFYLFFDPWFSLFKKKIGETVYGIGWLPLGGYVKIAGMIDESMDKEQMQQPPQAWEFRSKPAWQRLIIMIGGVTVNILVAFVIYAMVLYTWGEEKLPNSQVKNGIAIVDSLMYDVGLRDGDHILQVNGEPIAYFDDIQKKIIFGKEVKVLRDGKEVDIQLPVDMLGKLVERKHSRMALLMPRVPLIVDEVPDSSSAYAAGLRKGDRIVAVDSVMTPFYDQFKTVVDKKKGDSVHLEVTRNNRMVYITAPVSKEGNLGFYRLLDPLALDSMGIYHLEKKSYGFFASFPAGARLAMDKLADYIDQFKKILHPETGAYKGVGGFKTMGSIMPRQWGDWQTFWSITAFFSIILAFMNLLPIPALDGGHVLFTLWEMVTGRKPSEKFLEYAQVVGMVILLGLMVYANGNDWFGWGKGK